ncbi:MAG TPA: hypothetical protein ENH82_15060, partial [bacterium]|nr:hypothetical protein [bacterium]
MGESDSFDNRSHLLNQIERDRVDLLNQIKNRLERADIEYLGIALNERGQDPKHILHLEKNGEAYVLESICQNLSATSVYESLKNLYWKVVENCIAID